ncbi:MAG: PilZ domain-containing protein [Acidobacteriota bacterium]
MRARGPSVWGQLDVAATSIEAAASLLELRRSVARNITAAIKCLLEAQDAIELGASSLAVQLELVSAGLWAGAAENEIKDWQSRQIDGDVPQARELRAFPRFNLKSPIRLRPELLLTRSEHVQVPIKGSTVNISRGGALAQVDQGILQSGRYRVQFLALRGHGGHDGLWGTVRRSRATDAGWFIGIEFEQHLQDLPDFPPGC